ncbi:MAG: hypothetical protein OEY44_00080 [Candidatus Peregrinibacteria bacterium]|nr:hypothetical protein [Candidatus Peregrinibacteria bacterium]
MAKTVKKESNKSAQDKALKAADQFTKKADEVFDGLKEHFEPAKVDAWQEKWLALPKNRKKYKEISDAPEVVGEELVAMTNDIIQFAQGQEGGKSEVFKKLKKSGSAFFKNPIAFIQSKAAGQKPKSKGKKK